jgi:hypothetical protein
MVAKSKPHICPEDEEKTNEGWNDEKGRFKSFIEFRSR